MSRVYAIANQKGGTGKTTTAVNLAAALALRGQHTLLIDMDPQANATYALSSSNEFPWTTYQVLSDDITLRGAIVRSHVPNLDFIPSDIDLAAVEVELATVIGSQTILANKLRQENLNYKYIIIDCPPSLGLLTINALAAAHEVIIPVSASAFALKGLERLLETINKVRTRLGRGDLEIGGIVITFWERTNVSKDVQQILTNHFGSKVFESITPKTVKLEEANARHLTIFNYEPNCAAALAYRQLAVEILAGRRTTVPHNQITVGA